MCDMLGLSPQAVLRLKEGHAHGDLITAFIDFFLSSDGPYQKLAIIFENLRTVLKYSDNSYYKLYDDDISLTDDGKITLSVDSANMLYTTRAAASMSDSVMKFCHRVCRYPSRFQQARKEGTNG
ncbi:MAG: hypothetical protein E7442_00380 [Ruminococcaceae bacterium]|nr:hypothetical protein [Oscillospiraceae bacterium]